MLQQTLLLNLLIVLMPNLIHGYFNDVQKKGTSPYVYGILQGAAASLCLFFSYSKYGLFWDLRYIPLVLAFLYGGRVSGIITIGMIILSRTLVGGDALWFGYVSCLTASLFPFLLAKKFTCYKNLSRKAAAIVLGLWPTIVSFGIFLAYTISKGDREILDLNQLTDIFWFFMIHIMGLIISILINEAIIDRKLMKQEIKRTEEMRVQGELAASIAHEIRNPLTVVKGFLQLMQQRRDVAENVQYFQLTLNELGRAERIINDYLNVSKPHLEKIETFSIAEVASDLITLLEPLALKKGVELETDL
jgi:two-component system sporulation sensor kinase B